MTRSIAVFVPSLRGGGAERVMVTLCNAFVASGYPVDLVLVRAEGPYLSELSASVRIVDLRRSRVFTALPGLVRYLRKEKPVAMLSAMGHANVSAVVARGLARVATRVVVSERNHFSSVARNTRSWRLRAANGWVRWVYPHADAVVAISEGVADDLARAIAFPRERIRVVYNPVAIERVTQLAAEEPPHPWFDAGSIPVVLGVGRLTAAKDFQTLIRAFARVRATRAARLLILGEGEQRLELEMLVEQLGLGGDVALPGFVRNPFAAMRRARLFVLSSAWEGFGNVLVEAMACGTPVVATDCPSGPAEILENGRRGRLVPVGNADALAAAILASLDEPAPADVVSRAADFDVAQTADQYLRILGVRDDRPIPPLADERAMPGTRTNAGPSRR